MATVRIDSHRGPAPASAALWEDDPRVDADEHLLDRFLKLGESGAEAAFREIVRRHGPMVLGVCRHVLAQAHDAEDAFQATFLVLARRAGSIRDRRVLARWLYEVAYRIAVRTRTHTARRRACERQGAEMAAVAPVGDQGHAQDAAWAELRPVLHEEIRRLPEKYRSAVVLCYLEGRTNEEAAELLCWPVGTVKGRLFRAREMLRSRLTRRGLALSAGLLAVRLSHNAVFAEVVPACLAESTSRAAVRVARTAAAAGTPGSGAVGVPDRVIALVEDALRPVLFTWIGRQLGVLSLLLIVAAAVSATVSGATSARPAPAGAPAFLPPSAPSLSEVLHDKSPGTAPVQTVAPASCH